MVNSQVDIDSRALTDAQGSAGSIAGRLARSINADGTLKSSALDDALHNIAYHSDGSVTVGGTPISYVRMLNDERAKLSEISSGANKLLVKFNLDAAIPSSLPSQISVIGVSEIEFTDGIMELKASDSIYWSVGTDGAVKANTTFPATVRHLHHYDFVPEHQNIISPDYKNYLVTSSATEYRAGSLRVYINGVRLTRSDNIGAGGAPRANYVPTAFGGSPTWVTYTYTEGADSDGVVPSGKFSLSSAITSSDVITIDFDTLYVS